MTILQANLKHLYQRKLRLLGPLFLIAAAVVLTVEVADGYDNDGILIVCGMIAFMAGCFNAILPIEILTKPFSYCLPGHRTIPAKFLFVTGFVICVLFSLPLLFHPGLAFGKALLFSISAFFTYTVFYWVGAWPVFRFRSGFCAMSYCTIVVLYANNTEFPAIFERFIFKNYIIVIILGCAVNFFSWKSLNKNGLARR